MEQEFRALRKPKATSMDAHIKRFKQLRAEMDYQRLTRVAPLDKALVNLQFLSSLISGEDQMEDHIWETFQTALGARATTMPTEQLLAEAKAKDACRNSTSSALSQPDSNSFSLQAMVS